MPLTCMKISAAGNDFLCMDNRQQQLPLDAQERSWIACLCHRRSGLGADGLLIWESSAHADLRMRIFNADASEGKMCGNGLRAICLFARLNDLILPRYRIETLSGTYTATFEQPQDPTKNYRAMITTSMPDARDFVENIPLQTARGQARIGQYVHVGVPHLLIFLDETSVYCLEEEGPHFRYHPRFAPDGVNVHFVVKRQDTWHYRTYERGVEAETWACGTGATAIAAYLTKKGLAHLPLCIMPYSAIPLMVRAARCDDQSQLELSAEAIALFTLSLTPHVHHLPDPVMTCCTSV